MQRGRNDLIKKFFGGLFELFLHRIFIFLFPAPLEPAGFIFVVSAIQRYAWMVAQTHDIIDNFLPDIRCKFIGAWIHSTRKHHFLPYKDSVTVAEIIEKIVFVDSAAPYP